MSKEGAFCFPSWAPISAIATWEHFERDYRSAWAFKQMPQHSRERHIRRGDLESVERTASKYRLAKDMLFRVLTDQRMEEVWSMIDDWDAERLSGVKIYDPVFASEICSSTFTEEIVSGCLGPRGKTAKMTRKEFEQWTKAVIEAAKQLSSLIEGTELNSLIADDINSLRTKRCAEEQVNPGDMCFYLQRMQFAVSNADFKLPFNRQVIPEIQLARPNDVHADRKFFVLTIYNRLSGFMERKALKQLLLITTIVAYELDEFSFEMRQIDRYLKKTDNQEN